MSLKVLVACEFSQVVTESFTKRGHYAMSCDLLSAEKGYPHYQGDIVDIIINSWDEWDLMIAFPPCTYLTVTGNKWFKPEYRNRFPDREAQREDAIEFFVLLMEAPIPRIAIENPIGIMSTLYRKPDQIIQPYQFGITERKSTCLWLKGLPKLTPTDIVKPEIIQYKTRKGTDDAWHISTMHLPPLERMKARSRTFQGIADAMATQWSIE